MAERVPLSQKRAALKDARKKYEDANTAFHGSKSSTARNRALLDMQGAERMFRKVKEWD